MRRLIYFVALLFVACMTPSYPGVDYPSNIGGTSKDREIIDYINQRLSQEYYWLDEVEQKMSRFNTNLKWENYLGSALGMLQTNTDDGYLNSKGQRVFYSYIRETTSATRGDVQGFGIDLHYTIVVIDSQNGYYGFVVESVYPDSPAAMAGVKRGDIITKVASGRITSSNYAKHFNNIQQNKLASVELLIRRRATSDGQEDSFSVSLTKGAYDETPIVYSKVLEVEGYDKKIGYLVYTGFESEYDDDLIAVLTGFASEGVEQVILDLRCNGGGAIHSAVKLCSALVPEQYNDSLLCCVKRNERNKKMELTSDFLLTDAGQVLNLESLTVICSNYSASASELVIMGLRGLDFPVMLIGSTTEGKNCGMDVTRRTIAGTTVEFAPITFMCFNAKGVGDWGEGITPDLDLTDKENEFGVYDKNYPLPYADWGSVGGDIALASALAKITGRGLVQQELTRSVEELDIAEHLHIARQAEGIYLYCEE